MDAPTPNLSPALGSRDELLDRSRALLDEKRVPEALSILQELIDFDERDYEAWCLVAEAWCAWGHGSYGLRAAELALKLHPHQLSGHLWKCRCLLLLEQNREALEAVRTAMASTNAHPQVRRLLVAAHIACRQPDDAHAELEALALQFPEDPEWPVFAGQIHLIQDELERSEAYFGAALSGPHASEAWAGIGKIRLHQQRSRDAVPCFYQAALAGSPPRDYTRNFVELVDSQYEQQLVYLGAFYASMALVAVVIVYFIHPLIAVLCVAVAVWVWRLIRNEVVTGTLRHWSPEVGGYYRELLPRFARERQSKSILWVAYVLLLLGAGWGWSEFSNGGNWVDAVRIVAVLLPPVIGLWIRSSSTVGDEDSRVTFWFPQENSDAAADRLRPSDDDDPVVRARGQLRSRRHQAARRTAARVLTANPNNFEAHHIYSLALLAAGDVSGGLSAAQRLRQLAPHDPATWALRWVHLAAAKQPDTAAAESSERPEIAGPCREAFAGFVRDLLEAGAEGPARAATDLLQRLAPGSAEALALKGEGALRDGRWAEAEADFRRAHELAPEASIHLNGLGCAAWSRRRFSEARRYWLRAIALEPSDPSVAHNLGGIAFFTAGFGALAIGLGVLLAGLTPTLQGRSRNDWMIWATIVAPVVAALVTTPLRQLAIATLLTPLPAKALPGVVGRFKGLSAAVFIYGFAGALIFHTLQAWIEIAMHPALLPLRWKGAATVSLLAIYAVATVVAVGRSAEPTASAALPPTQEGELPEPGG